jgi:hypothetical protein
MSNEELERKMAFIVEQQAQFTSDIQQLREVQAQTDQLVGRVTLEGFKDVNVKINALVDSQIRTDENVSRTDKTLRNLIAVVDRYFSEGRNGR